MKKLDYLLLGLILLVVVLLGILTYNLLDKRTQCVLNPQKYYLTELEKANDGEPGSVSCTCTDGSGAGIVVTSDSTDHFDNSNPEKFNFQVNLSK